MTPLNRFTEGIWRNGSRLGLIALVIAAFVLGYLLRGSSTPTAPPAGESHAEYGAGHTQMWTCSMHPQIQLPNRGKCPICGMDLIPVTSSPMEDGGGLRTFTTSDAAIALMQLQTAPVERRFVTAEVRMVGKVDYDETKLAYISAWVPGRLDRLYVDYTGVRVNKGDHLVYMYSPEVLTAQEELRRASRALETMRAETPDVLKQTARTTYEAAREKLRRWGLNEEQLRAAEQQGTASDHITIFAPIGGTVIERNGREGMYVETGTPIYTIADLSEVWVKLDAYESDLPWIHYGQRVEFTTESYPGEVFEGKIAFISPTLDEMTRTVKVRVNVPNKDGRLKPQMFVRAIVRSQVATGGRVMDAALAGKWISPMHPEIVKDGPGTCDVCGMQLVRAEELGYVSAAPTREDKPLVIPASAPLITGKRAIVYVKTPDTEKPTFEGREIILGARAGDFYVVRSGLSEGELVVTNGNFKIDSALQILAKPSMMTPDGGGGAVHDHGEHGAQGSGPAAAAVFDPSLASLQAAFHSVERAVAMNRSDAVAGALAALESAVSKADGAPRSEGAAALWNEYSMRLKNDIIQLRDATNDRERAAARRLMSQTMKIVAERFGLETTHETAPKAPLEFRSQLPPLLDAYAALQTALADDDPEAARSAAERARSILSSVDSTVLDEITAGQWASDVRAKLDSSLKAFSDTTDIERQRDEFKSISATLIRGLGSLGLPDGTTLYTVHCPMADNNVGADWLQRDPEVHNPYMGHAMLKCGSVTGSMAGPTPDAPAPAATPHAAHEGHAR